jgi:hypothetical protein
MAHLIESGNLTIEDIREVEREVKREVRKKEDRRS